MTGSNDLQGLGAVVVGGGSGIGRGIALGLADEGVRVLVADIDAKNAEAVRDEIKSRGVDAYSGQVDATDRVEIARLAEEASAQLGQVNLLIQMVGVISDAEVSNSSEETWGWFNEFNLMSAVRVVETFLPLLRAHDGQRHIVITASMAGMLSLPYEKSGGIHLGLYTVAKHAVLGYGEALRQELAPEGIEVSTLCPGAANTNLDANSARHRPERFGGAMEEPKELDLPVRMSPEAMGPVVVRGIRGKRPYIFTHPERIDLVEEYTLKPMLADFAFYTEAAKATS